MDVTVAIPTRVVLEFRTMIAGRMREAVDDLSSVDTDAYRAVIARRR